MPPPAQPSDYFSPAAPLTAPRSAPTPPYTAHHHSHTTTTPEGPIITAITNSRIPNAPFPVADSPLHQFALHIPPPPPLSLANPAVRTHPPTPVTTAATVATIPLAHQRPQPGAAPPMSLASTPARHTLSVLLPPNIQPEMVTISANKGDRIRVVADAFGRDECHYEWQISFPPYDIDMAAVHARFDPDGRLTLDVKRRPRNVYVY